MHTLFCVDIYLRNVYESVRGYERKIVVNTRLSYLFEKLLNLSSIEYLVIFFENVLDGDLLAHYNASHIFQTFLEVSLKRMGSMVSRHYYSG